MTTCCHLASECNEQKEIEYQIERINNDENEELVEVVNLYFNGYCV